MPQFLARTVKLIWASPYTLLGAVVGLLGLATGGGVQRRRGAIEFHGGAVRWLLERVPGIGGAMAMTLGHTILGQTPAALDIAREHEHVHVRQFERWGPLMGPAYVGCSLWLWLCRSGRPYRDNPFEVEAYNHDDCRGSAGHDRAQPGCLQAVGDPSAWPHGGRFAALWPAPSVSRPKSLARWRTGASFAALATETGPELGFADLYALLPRHPREKGNHTI